MNISAFSSILVPVVAVIAIAVFIPAWFDASQNKEQYRRVKKDVKSKAKQIRQVSKPKPQTASAHLADRLFKLSLARRVISVLLLGSLALGGWSLTNLSENALAFGISCTVLVATILANRRTAVVKRALLLESVNVAKRAKGSIPAMHSYVEDLTQAVAEMDARAWTPVELPKPMHLLNKVGELEVVELATVSELNSSSSAINPVAENDLEVDEILRRRRAI